MRAMYRVWGEEGHRQKASWQKSVIFTTNDGYTIETWCFDRTGTHDYVDIEVKADLVSPADLYEEMQHNWMMVSLSVATTEKLKS